MNYLNPLASDVLGNNPNIFQQGMQKTSEWAGYVVSALKNAPEMFEQNPNAALTVIAASNVAFFFLRNYVLSRFESLFADQEKKADVRNYKQIIISESIAAGSTFVFNLLLSKATRAQLDNATLAAITATTVVLRVILNYFVYKQEEKPVKKDEKMLTPLPSPKTEKVKSPDLERVLRDSPEKPVIAVPLQKGSELAELKAKLARETARADKLQGEKSEISANIADLEAAIEKLKEEMDQLKDEKQAVESGKKQVEEAVAQLEDQRSSLKSEKEALEEKLQGVQTSLIETEAAKSEAEEALATLKEEILEEKTKAKDLAEQMKKEKAQSDDALAKAVNAAAGIKKGLDDKIAALIREKLKVEEDKKKVEKALTDAENKAILDLADLEQKKAKAEQEKVQAENELAEAKKKAHAAADEAKEAKRAEKAMEKEKKAAYREQEALEEEKNELLEEKEALQNKVRLQEDIIKQLKKKLHPIPADVKGKPEAGKTAKPDDDIYAKDDTEGDEGFKTPTKADRPKSVVVPKTETPDKSHARRNSVDSPSVAASYFSGMPKPKKGVGVVGRPPKFELPPSAAGKSAADKKDDKKKDETK